MGHLSPVLVATEAFGRDMRKILTRYRAPPELSRELEQHFTFWKSSIRQFHDARLGGPIVDILIAEVNGENFRNDR